MIRGGLLFLLLLLMSSARVGVISSHVLPNAVAAEQRVGITFHYEDKVSIPARRRTKVRWEGPVQRVLLVKKWRSSEVISLADAIVHWLSSKGVRVIVEEADLHHYPKVPGISTLGTSEGGTAVDLVVALGGDGTFLRASRLLRFVQRAMNQLPPPCLVIGMGSLGFLATVAAADWQAALMRALRGDVDPVPCTLRTRLRVCLGGPPSIPWYALNECAILSRGEAIGKLRLLVDGTFVTLVEGDGLIISTPTGSTGYSLSAGGPIVSPSVPGTLLTPIAPASLSFRPLLISELSTVEVLMPSRARSAGAQVVLDGREMGTIGRGDSVFVQVARPIPVLNVSPLDRDWFDAITAKLKWNARDTEQADLEPEPDESQAQ